MQYHHEAEKNYPTGTIVSTIGTAPYRTSKYLVETIKPTLNRNLYRVINSSSFVNGTSTLEITQEEIQVSYDIVNLYSSIPIDKATTVLIETLNNGLDYLNTGTKLKLTNTQKLTKFCLSKSYFHGKN